jgi:hypothetical protein
VSTLRLSDDLVLPLDAVTQVIGFLGRRGAGKSYSATKLAELMLDAHAQIVALDPVGIWHGLRLGNGFDIPVLGGLHGDIPLEPSSGSLVAELIVQRGISAVLDVSQMIASEQAHFACDFATQFFQLKKAAPSAVHLFLEECQEMAPENPQHGGMEPKMLHAFQRIVKLGRNFGIGVSLISQRPQEVSKKVLNQTELLLAFQTSGPQERKAIKGWIADKDIKEDIDALLPKLDVGYARAWSPQWLKVSKTIKVAQKRSLDASSTPKVGARAEAAKALTPIDLEKLRGAMTATIELAKRNDPKFLRARIAELEAAAKHQPAPVTKTLRVEVPVLTKEHHDAIVKLSEACFKVADLAGWKGPMAEIRERIAVLNPPHYNPTKTEIADAVQGLEKSGLVRTPPSRESRMVGGERIKHARAIAEVMNGTAPKKIFEQPAVVRFGKRDASGNPVLAAGQRAVLTVIAQHVSGVTRRQIMILTGRAKSTRDRLIYELKALGYVHDYGDHLGATETGLAALGDYQPLPTGDALREHWLQELPEGNRRVLEVICQRYPQPVSRDEISAATGHAKSTRDRLIYELAARKLVEPVAKKMVRASTELFD